MKSKPKSNGKKSNTKSKARKHTNSKKAVKQVTGKGKRKNNSILRSGNSKRKSKLKPNAKIPKVYKRVRKSSGKRVKSVKKTAIRKRSKADLEREIERLKRKLKSNGKKSKALPKGNKVLEIKNKKKNKGTQRIRKRSRKTKAHPANIYHKIIDGILQPSMRLELHPGSFKHKLEQIRNTNLGDWKAGALQKYNTPENAIAFMIVLQTVNASPDPSKGGEDRVFERANKMVFEIPLFSQTVIKHILSFMVEYQDEFIERVNEEDHEPTNSDWVYDPKRIENIFVRFFYRQESDYAKATKA